MNIITRTTSKVKTWHKIIGKILTLYCPLPRYRLLHFEQDSQNNYIATIQQINKNMVFYMKPEEILADDVMTDCFSQRDVRALAYLGYLARNAPKYKVLAKRLSTQNNTIIFAIQEKGKNKMLLKTASEISNDPSLLKGFDQVDAHMLGYTTATEQAATEVQQKKNILNKNSPVEE